MIKVLKLIMNHTNLLIWNAKCFSVDEALNRVHLVYDNCFDILLVETVGLKIVLQKFVFKLVVSSLS